MEPVPDGALEEVVVEYFQANRALVGVRVPGASTRESSSRVQGHHKIRIQNARPRCSPDNVRCVRDVWVSASRDVVEDRSQSALSNRSVRLRDVQVTAKGSYALH